MLLSPILSVTLSDPTRDALQATADKWFHWILISSGCVAVGVVLEIWEATANVWRWFLLKCGKQTTEPNEKSWAIPASYVALLFVIAGVVGESVFESFFSNADTALRAHDSQILAKAESDAADAEFRAAELEAETAKLEERTLELGPRELLLYGIREEAFLNGLRQFKGQKVQVRLCVFGNNEVRDTAERLTSLFNLAEWKVSPWSPSWGESNCLFTPPDSPAVPAGIWVGTPSATPDIVTQGRVRKLLELLEAIPLVATPHVVRPDTVRAGPSRTSIQGRYDDPDSIVVVLLSHAFERDQMSAPTNGPLMF